jgi:hypothetical protein
MVGQMPTTSGFIWGRGGRRRSLEDISLERRLAQQQMLAGSDFSPVQHWTQGLARVANGLAGGFRMQQADNQAEEARTAQDAVLQALVSGGTMEGGVDPVAAALADPDLRDIGMSALKSRTKAEDVPDIIALARIANDPTRPEWERQTAGDQVRVRNDPQAVIPLPGGVGTYVGPQSGIAAAFGQSPRPAAPSGPPPEAIQELLSDPSPDAIREFNEVFGTGQAESLIGARQGFTASSGTAGPTISRAQAEAMIAEKGRAFFDGWAQRNNVTVGN